MVKLSHDPIGFNHAYPPELKFLVRPSHLEPLLYEPRHSQLKLQTKNEAQIKSNAQKICFYK